VRKNISLLYGFSFFDQFMIVIPLWVPYLATKGISMAQFMGLQAIFALVILSGEVPTGLLSDRWGRKKVLLMADHGDRAQHDLRRRCGSPLRITSRRGR
jgi:MFS family permease